MRYSEIRPKLVTDLRTYTAKVKLRQPGYLTMIDVTVQARNPEMARRILRQQYSANAIVGQPKELR